MLLFIKQKIAYFYLVLSTFSLASLYLFIKLLPNVHYLNIAFFRFFFAFLSFVPFYYIFKSQQKILFKRNDFFIISLLVLFNGLAAILVVLATRYSNAAVSAILINFNPLFIALLAPILIKEKNKLIHIFGIIIALFGMLMIVTEGGAVLNLWQSTYFYGYIFGIIDALAICISTIYIRKYLEKYGTLFITLFSFIINSFFLAIADLIYGNYQQIFSLAPLDWLWLILIGLFSTTVAFTFFFYGIKMLGPTKAAVFKLLVPIFAVVLSMIFLKESLQWYVFAGGMISIFGLYLTQKK